jgi:hypothetical protein
MTASGLRKEAARGRLAVERIAGKDFTTLAAIANMRTLCRLAQVPQGYISASGETEQTAGSYSIADARSAQAHLRTSRHVETATALPESTPPEAAHACNALRVQQETFHLRS